MIKKRGRPAKAKPVEAVLPEAPKTLDIEVNVQSLLINAYRAIMPDIEALTTYQKDELLALIEIDTRAETTYKFPEKQRTREMLKAKLLG